MKAGTNNVIVHHLIGHRGHFLDEMALMTSSPEKRLANSRINLDVAFPPLTIVAGAQKNLGLSPAQMPIIVIPTD